MTLRRIAAGLSLIVALNLALAPSAAVAGGRVIVGRPLVSHPFVQRPFVARPFFSHHVFPHHFVRPFVPFGVGVVVPPLGGYYAAPPVYYSTPYYSPPAYYDSSTYYAPPVSAAPSPRPMQTVVEYPNGRYELRGDGVTTPYTWVWIPNPPPPPASPPPAGSPAPSGPSSSRPTSLYRWIDEQGGVHLTDSLDAVPKTFRAQARQAQP